MTAVDLRLAQKLPVVAADQSTICRVDWYPRSWWTKLPSTASLLPPSSFTGWVLHHTVMTMGDYDRDGFLHGDTDDVARYMEILRTIRPDLGGEVPYNVVVFQGVDPNHGIVVEGRGIYRRGAHTAGLNTSRMAWAVASDTRSAPVTKGMETAMRWVAGVTTPSAATPTIGHSQAPPYYDSRNNNLNATACPGTNALAALPRLQPPFTTPSTQVDPMSIYHHFKLHPDALNKVDGVIAEPVDWVVTGGDKAPCGSTGFLADIARDPSTYRFHDLSRDVDASRWFRQGHP